MDFHNHDVESDEDVTERVPPHQKMPADLPRSLDDRQPVRTFGEEMEMYDAWQGKVRTSPFIPGQ